VKKALDAVSLIYSVMGFLKSVAIIFAVTMVDWARRKQKIAEFQRDKAENDLEIEVKLKEVDNESREKSSDEVIDNFLDRELPGYSSRDGSVPESEE